MANRFSTRTRVLSIVVLAVAAAILVAHLRENARSKSRESGEKFDWSDAHERDILCPRRQPNIRNAECILPAIPHLVTPEGMVPACYRVKSFVYSTNSEMFRGRREFPAGKPPDVFRIVIQGTGVTFGNGVDDHEVYPVVLEQMLNDDPLTAGKRAEVYNMGIPGSCTDIGLELLTNRVIQIDFDLLMFCYGVNDGLPMFGRSGEQYARTLHEIRRVRDEHKLRVLFAIEPRGTFYPWPYGSYEETFREIIMADPASHVLDFPELLDAVEKDHGLRLENVGGQQKVVQYENGQPSVLMQTAYEPGPGKQAIAQEVYDFLDTHPVDQATLIDGVHLTPEGHRVVAREIYAYLKAHPELLEEAP